MTNESRGLHVGLADFAESALLLLGHSTDFSWLAELFSSGEFFVLKSTVARPPVSLHVVPSEQAGSLTRQGRTFKWRITAVEAQTVAGQLQELAAAEKPAHAYLDPTVNSTDVQVIASCGEYEPSEIFG